jgi:hypothetical protein
MLPCSLTTTPPSAALLYLARDSSHHWEPNLKHPFTLGAHQEQQLPDIDAKENLLIVYPRLTPSCPPPLPLVSHQEPKHHPFYPLITFLSEPDLRAAIYIIVGKPMTLLCHPPEPNIATNLTGLLPHH